MDRKVARHPQVGRVCAPWHRFWLDGRSHLREGKVWGGTKRGYGCGSQAATGRLQLVTHDCGRKGLDP
jgi:hypothetical protein